MNRRHAWQAAVMVAAIFATVVPALAAGAEDPAAWAIDPAHTEIAFSVQHFFTPVTGRFDEFEIELDYDPGRPERSSVAVKIPVASVNTGNAKRDAHLRTADWFEVDKYPHITFRSTSVRSGGDGRLVARGPLTIKGVSREIELPIALLGRQPIPEPMRAMLGGTREVASFQATAAVDRGDFGVGVGSWAATMVVGGEVGIEILAEAHRR